MSADWWRRLPELVIRLEEILFRKHRNKTEYFNMAKGSIQPYLHFALRALNAHQNQKQQQRQQSSVQTASSPGCITQGASGTSGMSYVTYNMDLSSSAGLVPQNATMGTSLPGGAPDNHVNTMLTLGINPTQHDCSTESNNNNDKLVRTLCYVLHIPNVVVNVSLNIYLTLQAKVAEAHAAPLIKDLPREPKFSCPVCMNELVDASSTICGHIFCQKCIEASIKAQKKCPTCRRKLTMRSFHRVYLPMMD
ncbi:E3 ubiquitin-protein ligase RNF220-like [Hordeum vulgare subsp. vulgare]|uniref:E3 ubiquitin-protein ligase RNF220-like n=1 Tax=Hordeum vulgare subsp. vulgare TaxID=112509 RepID=UPI001D1A3979|nr:E3 ubiquitin-protein ligase RNF220-like [Hordeum vulgare subsp. vulgare]